MSEVSPHPFGFPTWDRLVHVPERLAGARQCGGESWVGREVTEALAETRQTGEEGK
jgi:hypothetical protein